MVREESRSNWIRHFLGTRYIMKDGCGVGVRVKKKSPLGCKGLWYWATTYSPTGSGSTIGAVGLNFSVRNGKRCAPTL